MEQRRLKLNEKLKEIVPNVYYEPPESIKLKFPCIVYEREPGHSDFADNNIYRYVQGYTITYIDHNIINDIMDKLLQEFQMIRFSRHFVKNNLHHDVYYLYF